MLHKSATDRSGTRDLLWMQQQQIAQSKEEEEEGDVCWLLDCERARARAHTPRQQKNSKTIFPIKHSESYKLHI